MARSFTVPCTVRITHTAEELSAHVELDGDLDLGPGDRVAVHGGELLISYGEVRTERRVATVTRASGLARLWTRLTGDLDCLDLLDVSFTDRRTL